MNIRCTVSSGSDFRRPRAALHAFALSPEALATVVAAESQRLHERRLQSNAAFSIQCGFRRWRCARRLFGVLRAAGELRREGAQHAMRAILERLPAEVPDATAAPQWLPHEGRSRASARLDRSPGPIDMSRSHRGAFWLGSGPTRWTVSLTGCFARLNHWGEKAFISSDST